MKKKSMLAKICDTFLNQNFDLYLQHEIMLDDEKKQREEIAKSFQDRMKELSSDINGQKDERR